jgi:hypothetical protein
LGLIWGLFGAYLGLIWGLFGAYLGLIWGIDAPSFPNEVYNAMVLAPATYKTKGVMFRVGAFEFRYWGSGLRV